MVYLITRNQRQEIEAQHHYTNCRAVLLTKFSVEPTNLAIGQIITALEAARFVHPYEKWALGNKVYSRNGRIILGSPYKPDTDPLLICASSQLISALGRLPTGERENAGRNLYLQCINALKRTSVERPIENQYTGQDTRESRSIPMEWNGAKFSVLEAARFVLHYEQNNAEPVVLGQRLEPLFGQWNSLAGSRHLLEIDKTAAPLNRSIYIDELGFPSC